ncbi:hypothetical protein LXL04_015432 [Taraxacum kok-saghyz]
MPLQVSEDGAGAGAGAGGGWAVTAGGGWEVTVVVKKRRRMKKVEAILVAIGFVYDEVECLVAAWLQFRTQLDNVVASFQGSFVVAFQASLIVTVTTSGIKFDMKINELSEKIPLETLNMISLSQLEKFKALTKIKVIPYMYKTFGKLKKAIKRFQKKNKTKTKTWCEFDDSGQPPTDQPCAAPFFDQPCEDSKKPKLSLPLIKPLYLTKDMNT